MEVKDIMTMDLFTLQQDDTLDLVDDLMEFERIRHIPVVDSKETLVGLVTHRDLVKASVSSWANLSAAEQKEAYRWIPVKDIMTRDIRTTTPDTDLRDAAEVMLEEKIGCLLVVENQKLAGIITEADFLKLAWEQPEVFVQNHEKQLGI